MDGFTRYVDNCLLRLTASDIKVNFSMRPSAMDTQVILTVEDDPKTRHVAREQSLEDVPESTGYVLFIPDCDGQGQEWGHISDRLKLCRRGGCFEKKTR